MTGPRKENVNENISRLDDFWLFCEVLKAVQPFAGKTGVALDELLATGVHREQTL